MSENMLVPAGMQLPAHLQNVESSVAVLQHVEDALPKLSLRGRRFRLVKDGEERVAPEGVLVNVIIVGVAPNLPKTTANVYFEGAYTPGSDDPPDCTSIDGVYPDSHSKSKQSSDCSSCPKNVWGSAQNDAGEDRKACTDIKRLLVRITNGDGTLTDDIYQLNVPPASLKALTQYAKELERQNVPTVYAGLTQLVFVDSEFPQIEFRFGGWLTPEQYAIADECAKSKEVQDRISAKSAPSAPTEKPASTPSDTPANHGDFGADVAFAEGANAADTTGDWGSEAQVTHPAQGQPANNAQGQPANNAQDQHDALPVIGQPDVNGNYWDSAGAMWDATIHATAQGGVPSYKKDNTFKARVRRGGAKAAQQTPVQTNAAAGVVQGDAFGAPAQAQQTTPAASDDDSGLEGALGALGEWGQ